MRRRWSVGVVVAIVVAIWAATNSGAHSAPVRQAGQPIEVTLSLHSDGVELRVAHESLALSVEF